MRTFYKLNVKVLISLYKEAGVPDTKFNLSNQIWKCNFTDNALVLFIILSSSFILVDVLMITSFKLQNFVIGAFERDFQ